MTMAKSLDRRLAAILAGRYTPDDFIIADAKDADMAKGVAAGGPPRDARGRAGPGFRTRRAYLDDMAAVVQQGVIDILLASASSGERLAQGGASRRAPSPSPSAPTTRPTSGWRAAAATPRCRRAPSAARASS